MTRGSATSRGARRRCCTGAGDKRLRAAGRMCLLAALFSLAFASPSSALVDLELRPASQSVALGETVDVGVYAVDADATNVQFSALSIVLRWDSTILEFQEVLANGPHAWTFVFGFSGDAALDWLNASWNSTIFTTSEIDNDGDALFEAASFATATATEMGLLIATFRFVALEGTSDTPVTMERTFGASSATRVLAPGNLDVTGSLAGTSIAIADILRFADLQVCFTGPEDSPSTPPAYPVGDPMHCEEYDVDDDGDIDSSDYRTFADAIAGQGG